MRYVAIDLETTSLDPHPQNVLEVAMVVEDTSKSTPIHELPYLNLIVCRPEYKGHPTALAMNAEILRQAGEVLNKAFAEGVPEGFCIGDQWIFTVQDFLNAHFGNEKATPAGKNVGSFDLQFMPPPVRVLFHHRCIDPGSAEINWDMDRPPGLDEIKAGYGMPKVKHRALEDARDVVRVLRAHRDRLARAPERDRALVKEAAKLGLSVGASVPADASKKVTEHRHSYGNLDRFADKDDPSGDLGPSPA